MNPEGNNTQGPTHEWNKVKTSARADSTQLASEQRIHAQEELWSGARFSSTVSLMAAK